MRYVRCPDTSDLFVRKVDMSAITYDKIESGLYLAGAVLCVALAVVVLLLWRKLRASGRKWDEAYAGWVSAYTTYSKRREDDKPVETDGAAQ